MNINIELTPARLRQIYQSIFSTQNQMSTEQAEAFLLLHGPKLQDELNECVREFLRKKLA